MKRAFAANKADSAVEWTGAIGLAFGLSYAVWLLGGAILATATGAGGFLAGMAILTRIGTPTISLPYFEPTSLDLSDHSKRGIRELLEIAGGAITDLANSRVDEDDVLILDDPLVDVDGESRVFRLFTPNDGSPGNLIAKIEDFFDRKPVPMTRPIPDASDALYAALTNIRKSLR